MDDCSEPPRPPDHNATESLPVVPCHNVAVGDVCCKLMKLWASGRSHPRNARASLVHACERVKSRPSRAAARCSHTPVDLPTQEGIGPTVDETWAASSLRPVTFRSSRVHAIVDDLVRGSLPTTWPSVAASASTTPATASAVARVKPFPTTGTPVLDAVASDRRHRAAVIQIPALTQQRRWSPTARSRLHFCREVASARVLTRLMLHTTDPTHRGDASNLNARLAAQHLSALKAAFATSRRDHSSM
jgi:hypothetical protein